MQNVMPGISVACCFESDDAFERVVDVLQRWDGELQQVGETV